ncbi:MAG TPA: hypothetical protein VGM50_18155 [Gemmatimonadaceae bacterium]|jgi:hypothetical protein
MDDLVIRREVAATPEQTLEALRNEIREWRESTIPTELRELGVLRVGGSVSTSRFSMGFFGGEPRHGSVRLRGDALQTSTGTVIAARVGRCPRRSPLTGVFLCASIISFMVNDWAGLAFVLLSVPGVAIRFWQRGWFPDWYESRARYLVTRLDAALASASHLPDSGVGAKSAMRRPANER